MTWATFEALHAAGAFAVIDDGHVVYQVNCIVGAQTLALATGDTASFASGHNVLATALGTASNVNFGRYRHALDELFGAGGNAQPTATTALGIDVSITFVALDGKVRAGINATTATHATCLTHLASACK